MRYKAAMKIFWGLLLLIFLVFSGYHLTFREFRLPMVARRFYLTGTEFLFLGLLLGPHFLNVLDDESLRGLEPLSGLAIGWSGLLFGFQFDIAKLRRIPADFLAGAVTEGLVTFVLTFFISYPAVLYLFDLPVYMEFMTALTLAAAASCTSQTGLALLAPETVAGTHRKTVRLLTYISNMDGFIALLLMSLAFLFHPQTVADASWTAQLGWGISGSIVTGIGLALLCSLFLTRRRKESELILVVIGTALLTSGLASLLHFSPLLSNFFVGVCLVNISSEKNRIFKILASVEKPVYLMILIFLGVNWRCRTAETLLLAGLLGLVRMIGKLSGGLALTRLSPELKNYPSALGLGLLEMGGLSLAILLDFQQNFPPGFTSCAVSAALGAVICSNFISSYFLDRLLKNKN